MVASLPARACDVACMARSTRKDGLPALCSRRFSSRAVGRAAVRGGPSPKVKGWQTSGQPRRSPDDHPHGLPARGRRSEIGNDRRRCEEEGNRRRSLGSADCLHAPTGRGARVDRPASGRRGKGRWVSSRDLGADGVGRRRGYLARIQIRSQIVARDAGSCLNRQHKLWGDRQTLVQPLPHRCLRCADSARQCGLRSRLANCLFERSEVRMCRFTNHAAS